MSDGGETVVDLCVGDSRGAKAMRTIKILAEAMRVAFSENGHHPENPRLALSAHEVAEQLGLPVPYVREQCRRGKIKASRIGKSWLITPEAIQEWLLAHRYNPTKPVPTARVQNVPKKKSSAGATRPEEPDDQGV